MLTQLFWENILIDDLTVTIQLGQFGHFMAIFVIIFCYIMSLFGKEPQIDL